MREIRRAFQAELHAQGFQMFIISEDTIQFPQAA